MPKLYVKIAPAGHPLTTGNISTDQHIWLSIDNEYCIGYTPDGITHNDDSLYYDGYFQKEIDITPLQKTSLQSYTVNDYYRQDNYNTPDNNNVTFVFEMLRFLGIIPQGIIDNKSYYPQSIDNISFFDGTYFCQPKVDMAETVNFTQNIRSVIIADTMGKDDIDILPYTDGSLFIGPKQDFFEKLIMIIMAWHGVMYNQYIIFAKDGTVILTDGREENEEFNPGPNPDITLLERAWAPLLVWGPWVNLKAHIGQSTYTVSFDTESNAPSTLGVQIKYASRDKMTLINTLGPGSYEIVDNDGAGIDCIRFRSHTVGQNVKISYSD